jgi:hypothetical protein
LCLVLESDLPTSWTSISIVPSLTTTVAWFHNTKILCITVPLRWWWCRVRRLKIGALNLSLRSLKSLTYSLHSRLPTLLPRQKLGPCEEEPTQNLVLLS